MAGMGLGSSKRASENLGVSKTILGTWGKTVRENNGEVPVRGSGNFANDGAKGIDSLVNISYCAMKIFPYTEETCSQYRGGSIQEFRFATSGRIRQQVFYVNLVHNIEIHINQMSLPKY